MSVCLTISTPGKETEFVRFCGQRAANEWVAIMAKQHGFKLLDGMYPIYLLGRDRLDQAIWEIGILRDDSLQRIRDDDDRVDRKQTEMHWDRLIARLNQLKSEQGWEAHFG